MNSLTCNRTQPDSAASESVAESSSRPIRFGLITNSGEIEPMVDPPSPSGNRIAVWDVECDLSESGRRWALESLDQADIVCYFSDHRLAGNVVVRCLIRLFEWIVSGLFRVRKQERQSGCLFVSADAWRTLYPIAKGAETTTELTRLARRVTDQIVEFEIRSPLREALEPSLKREWSRFVSAVRFWWTRVAFPGTPIGGSSRDSDSVEVGQPPTGLDRLLTWGLALLAGGILFSQLNYPFFEPDEARNAQLALNILESGDWCSLTIDGEYYWDKPPLQAWMTALSFRTFGAGPLAIRLPVALMGFLTILAVSILGSRLIGRRAANLAGLLLLLCLGFAVISRYATMDATLILFTTTMMLSLMLASASSIERYRWYGVAGVAFGWGLLAKGPIIGVLVLPPWIAWRWLNGRPIVRDWRMLAAVGIPALAIALPWYLAMSWSHPSFLSYFFWKHHVMRFADAFNHREPWWYYGPVLLIMMYPTILTAPWALRPIVSKDAADRERIPPVVGGIALMAIWVLAFFSVSQAKLPTYIMPAVPFICLLMAQGFAMGSRRAKSVGLLRRLADQARLVTGSVTLIQTLGVAAVLIIFGRAIAQEQKAIWIGATVLLALVAAVAHGVRADRWRVALAALAASMFVGTGTLSIIPQIAKARSTFIAIGKDAPAARGEVPVVYFGRPPHAHSLVIPTARVLHFDDESRIQAVDYLERHPEALVVASKGDVKQLQRDMDHSVIFETSQGNRRLYRIHVVASRQASSPDRVADVGNAAVSTKAVDESESDAQR